MRFGYGNLIVALTALAIASVLFILTRAQGNTSLKSPVLRLPDIQGVSPFYSPKDSYGNISVPFYIYNDQAFKNLEASCDSDIDIFDDTHADFYFNDHMKNHRWRVKNPEDALLFVVPIPWGRLFERFCDSVEENLGAVKKLLKSSPWYQRHGGKDHLTVANQWWMARWMSRNDNETIKNLKMESNFEFLNIIKNMITTSHYLTPTSSCRFVVPYPRYKKEYLQSNSTETKKPTRGKRRLLFSSERFQSKGANRYLNIANEDDVIKRAISYLKERKYTLGFAGQVRIKPVYHLRRVALEKLPGFLSPNIIVGTVHSLPKNETTCTEDFLEGCHMSWDSNSTVFRKAVRESKYCLFFRGDDWTSARLYDCIASGSAVIAVSDGLLDLGLPLQCDVDWKKVLIQVPEDEFEQDPRGALAKYMPDPNTTAGLIDLGTRLAEIERIRPIVIFNEPKSLTSELILIDAVRKCLPENHIKKYHYQHRNSSDVIVKSSLASLTDLRCTYPDYSKIFADPKYIGQFFENVFNAW